MLCRVFHKRKGEVARSSSTVENLENSSPPLMVDQSTVAEGCCSEMTMGSSVPTNVSHQEGNSSNTFLNLAELHYNFLDFPQELDTTGMTGMEMGMGSKDDEAVDHGFLLDVGLDDEDGVGSVKGNIGDVEDIRF